MTDVPPDLAFLQWLIDVNRYLRPRPLPGGHWAAIMPMIFTHAIGTGRIGDYFGIENSWCYESREEAEAALEAWSGSGEPDGWIRHPPSGRRRPSGDLEALIERPYSSEAAR